MAIADEARAVARAKVEEIAALPWEALDAYEERVEEVPSPSDEPLRVNSYTFWDMEEWASAMYVVAKVYTARGWRRWWPYKDVATRGGPDDPGPERPQSIAPE